MQVRLYLPKRTHRLRIPCLLVPPAGTNLMHGSRIDERLDNPAIQPYLDAGYAVVTFSLDGWVDDARQANHEELGEGYRQFHSACAGLINVRKAIQFARSVPQVSPDYLYIVGHGSAGTLALLSAAHEPRALAGCIAYAPQADVEASLSSFVDSLPETEFPGAKQFLKRSSPMTHLSGIECPVFVYHAAGDSVTSFPRARRFCEELKRQGKDMTFIEGTGSDHHQTMVSQGIPAALEWLAKQTEWLRRRTSAPPVQDHRERDRSPQPQR